MFKHICYKHINNICCGGKNFKVITSPYDKCHVLEKCT